MRIAASKHMEDNRIVKWIALSAFCIAGILLAVYFFLLVSSNYQAKVVALGWTAWAFLVAGLIMLLIQWLVNLRRR